MQTLLRLLKILLLSISQKKIIFHFLNCIIDSFVVFFSPPNISLHWTFQIFANLIGQNYFIYIQMFIALITDKWTIYILYVIITVYSFYIDIN